MNPIRVYDYLVASRARLFGWVRPLTPEQYRSEHPIGLGSLARTLHHVAGAERSYMLRLAGHTDALPTPPPEHDPEVTTEAALPFADLERVWTEQAKQTAADLAAVTDWAEAKLYTTAWDGKPMRYRATPADFFTQLALHEVHHRAQVLHMLKRLGVETEDVDYNGMMWEVVGEG